MRFQLFIKTFFIGIALFFGMPFAVSVTQAQSIPPAPTPRPQTAAPANGQYKVFLPLIQSTGSSEPAPLFSKKGVPLTYNDCPTVTAVKGSWQYAWTANPPICEGVENVPMIFGSYDQNYAPGGNSAWLMGFNEPDLQSQADLSISDAVRIWRKLDLKFQNRKLLAPAPSGANPEWIVSFYNTYSSTYGKPPRLNGLAMHCYAWSATDCINITQKFISWSNAWGIPEVWVTEFSFSPYSSPDQALLEAQTFINWMTNQTKITRYAWFASKVQGNEAWLSPYFITPLAQWSNGQLTQYGSSYASYR